MPFLKKFRIMTDGFSFKPQRRVGLIFWVDFTVETERGTCYHTCSTLKEAEEYIESERRRRQRDNYSKLVKKL